MYLFDTDVIIDFLKHREPGYSTVSRLTRENSNISIITWIEVSYGIKKSQKAEKHRKEFNDFLSHFDISIINIDKKTAKEFVDLQLSLEREGQRLDDSDLFIASTAIANNLKLVTRNIKHFSRIKNISLSV